MFSATVRVRVAVLSAIAFATMNVPVARAEDIPAEENPPAMPEPERRGSPTQGAGFGTGGVGVVASRVVEPAPSEASQPNLRHATDEYQVTFAVSPADAAIIRLLEKPIGEGGIPLLDEAPLHELATWVSKNHKATVRIDHRSLEDAGLDMDVPLSRPSPMSSSLGAALRALLEQVDLTLIVEHEAIVFTTKEKAEEQLIVGVYPLPTQVESQRLDGLLVTIRSIIAEDTWDFVGGRGAIRPLPGCNAIMISQSLDVHMNILSFMRATFEEDVAAGPDDAAGRLPIRVYNLSRSRS